MIKEDIKEDINIKEDIKIKKLSIKDFKEEELKDFKKALELNNKDNAIVNYFNIFNNNSTYVKNKIIRLNKSALLEVKNILSDILSEEELKALKNSASYKNNCLIYNNYNKAIKNNKDLFIINTINCTSDDYNNKTYKK